MESLKPVIITEPVIGIANGKMSTRTTIACRVSDEGALDAADFLADALWEYQGRNIQIVIDVIE